MSKEEPPPGDGRGDPFADLTPKDRQDLADALSSWAEAMKAALEFRRGEELLEARLNALHQVLLAAEAVARVHANRLELVGMLNELRIWLLDKHKPREKARRISAPQAVAAAFLDRLHNECGRSLKLAAKDVVEILKKARLRVGAKRELDWGKAPMALIQHRRNLRSGRADPDSIAIYNAALSWRVRSEGADRRRVLLNTLRIGLQNTFSEACNRR